jgi:hypothetical protein
MLHSSLILLFCLFCHVLSQTVIISSLFPAVGPFSTTINVQGTNLQNGQSCIFTDNFDNQFKTLFTLEAGSTTQGFCIVPFYLQPSENNPAITASLNQYSVVVFSKTGYDAKGPNFTIVSSNAHPEPHFNGFNGESVHIKIDQTGANQLFHVYCSPSVTITTLFTEYPGKLLFMTNFWIKLGNTLFTLKLSTKPTLVSSVHEGPFYLQDVNKFRAYIEDGILEWDDKRLQVIYKYLHINFTSKIHINNVPYLTFDIATRAYPSEENVTGIVGRTLHKSLSNREFEECVPFRASVSDVVSFSCSSLLR